jgi:hypothetical protein
LTSFGQQRVAGRLSQFDSINEYALDTRAWGTQTANGGAVTFNSTTGTTDLTVTGASGSTARLRTNSSFIYQPGAVSRPLLTVALGQLGTPGQVVRWGYFDDSDGLFFELNGTDLSVVRRTSTSGAPVDVQYARASWQDQYSTLNLLNGSRYEIDFAWLAFGPVHWTINGRGVYTHDFGNDSLLPYIRCPQLPISCEIVNTGAAAPGLLRFSCATMYLDGGDELRFAPGFLPTVSKTGIGTTYTPIAGLRIRDTINGRPCRKLVIPTKTRVANASGRATVGIILNPTSTTGGSWVPVTPLSGVEYNTGITSYVGPVPLSEIYLPTSAASDEFDGHAEFSLNGTHLRKPAFGAPVDTVLFVAKADTGTTDISLSPRWQELG